MSSPDSDTDSLFNESSSGSTHDSGGNEKVGPSPAKLSASIPGLYIFPSLLSHDAARAALAAIADADHFVGGSRDQVMLFTDAAGLPPHIQALEGELQSLLRPLLPDELVHLAFGQQLARQVILNLYPAGAGISSHIDLPSRYADGIVGVSLAGGCVMRFERAAVDASGYRVDTEAAEQQDVYLPPRSVYLLSGPARWEWAHAIPSREFDLVEYEDGVRTLPRSLRVSVTLRWLAASGGLLS